MRISRCIDIPSQLIEIEVTGDDIRSAFFERLHEPENSHELLPTLNSIADFFAALGDELIAGMLEGQRAFVGRFLMTQAQRFMSKPDSAEANAPEASATLTTDPQAAQREPDLPNDQTGMKFEGIKW